MFSKLFAFAALAAVANAEHFIMGGSKLIVQTRLDPIVNPGKVGTHVHAVVGASRFKDVYDREDQIKSKCTTVSIQSDKSNYWAPQMFHHDPNGGLTPMPTSFNIYYLVRNGPKNEKVHAFPPGLRMVAGDTTRRTYNASSFADQAVSYVCLDYSGAHNNDPDWAERPDFFDHNCPDGMRAQVFFPSCWDGKNLDSADHKSHMAYPIQNYNSGDCPDSHPVHLVSLFYEMFVSVDQFEYHGKGTWVLANGDTTGDGHHGDFQDGWDTDLLQEALDTCTNMNGNIDDCPPLKAVVDQAAADACVLETSIVDEDIGLNGPIAKLPGCNPIYGTNEACTNGADPALVPAQQPLPSGWTELGCIAEGTNGRALPAVQTKFANMTKAMCASYCGSQGYKLAGAEFSDECYCDNSVKNGASENFLTWSQCSNHCAGNNNEICGGAAKLTLMSLGAAPAAPASPATASSVPSAATQPISSANPSTGAHTSVATTQSAPSVGTISAKTAPTSLVAKPVPTTISVAKPVPTTTSVAKPVPTTTSVAKPVPTAAGPSNSTNVADLPAGWTAVGCASDVPQRALNVDAFTSERMTIEACVTHCSMLGHSIAGLEYSRECYCGAEFVNGGGQPLADSACNMACAGDASRVCGGPMALTVFKKNGASSAVRRHNKARRLGRGHAHGDTL
ncbi:WSC-domain-containing protein [Trametes gibbosa]|nr:WSC-domain-containing protein [Trametes gibbosa]